MNKKKCTSCEEEETFSLDIWECCRCKFLFCEECLDVYGDDFLCMLCLEEELVNEKNWLCDRVSDIRKRLEECRRNIRNGKN